MPTFETLPHFERDWKNLSSQGRALVRKVVLEAFVPDQAGRSGACGREFLAVTGLLGGNCGRLHTWRRRRNRC